MFNSQHIFVKRLIQSFYSGAERFFNAKLCGSNFYPCSYNTYDQSKWANLLIQVKSSQLPVPCTPSHFIWYFPLFHRYHLIKHSHHKYASILFLLKQNCLWFPPYNFLPYLSIINLNLHRWNLRFLCEFHFPWLYCLICFWNRL